MAFLRGGAWGNVTARARRVGVDLMVAFPLVALDCCTFDPLLFPLVALPLFAFPLVALDCCTFAPLLFPLVCVAFERCASRDALQEMFLRDVFQEMYLSDVLREMCWR